MFGKFKNMRFGGFQNWVRGPPRGPRESFRGPWAKLGIFLFHFYWIHWFTSFPLVDKDQSYLLAGVFEGPISDAEVWKPLSYIILGFLSYITNYFTKRSEHANTERTHRNRSSKTTSSMLLFGAFKGTSAVNVEGGASVGPSLAPPTFLPAGSNWLRRLFERPLHLTSTVKRLACVSVEESSWRAGRFDGSNFHYCQVGAVVPEDTRDTSNRIGTRMQKLLPWSFTNVPFPRGLECVSRYLYPSISIYLSDLSYIIWC